MAVLNASINAFVNTGNIPYLDTSKMVNGANTLEQVVRTQKV